MKEWLVAIREGQKMTQEMVADLVGIAQGTYSNIENGKRRPGVAVAKRIAAVLNFDWTLFFQDAEEESA